MIFKIVPAINTSLEVTQRMPKIQILWIVLGWRSFLFLIELGAGIWSHSLSLLAASGHLFSDLVNLGLTLLVTWLVDCKSEEEVIFEYRGIEIWVAIANGISLIFLSFLIAREAIEHLQTTETLQGLPMLIVAGLSLLINSYSINLLHENSHRDLNFRAILLHGVADAASSFGVMVSAVVIYFCNWLWADAIVSLLVATILSLSAVSLMRDSLQAMK